MEPTQQQAENLAQLEQRWQEEDALEATVQRAYGVDKQGSKGARALTSPARARLEDLPRLTRDSPAEAMTAIIDRLEDKRTGLRGGEAMFAILQQIATEGKHDRDRIRAAELVLAYRYGRPAQTILTADVTPQWAEHQIRQRYPHLTNEQVAALLAKLTTQGALPEPT